MEKIPTAEELYHLSKGGNVNISKKQFIEAVKKYAKLHVKAALQAALESIPCLGSSTDIATYEEVEKEVLNSYPENLIV